MRLEVVLAAETNGDIFFLPVRDARTHGHAIEAPRAPSQEEAIQVGIVDPISRGTSP
jgi:hypothetical protein